MFKTIAKFVHEARVELAKVTWPTRQAAINLTLIVIGVSLMFMLYVMVVDYGLTTGIKWLTTTASQNNTSSGGLPDDVQVTPVTEPIE